MESVSVRELRNHGGEVLQRVSQGHSLVVTRDGHEVARIEPLPRPSSATEQLIARRRHLPPIDVEAFRADLDDVLDSSI